MVKIIFDTLVRIKSSDKIKAVQAMTLNVRVIDNVHKISI